MSKPAVLHQMVGTENQHAWSMSCIGQIQHIIRMFHDPTPVQQGISVYYGDMVYGNVGFAILGDRQFKSGPQHVDTGSGRADHVKGPKLPNFCVGQTGPSSSWLPSGIILRRNGAKIGEVTR